VNTNQNQFLENFCATPVSACPFKLAKLAGFAMLEAGLMEPWTTSYHEQ
jgi:hypothetical protein